MGESTYVVGNSVEPKGGHLCRRLAWWPRTASDGKVDGHMHRSERRIGVWDQGYLSSPAQETVVASNFSEDDMIYKSASPPP